MTWLVVVEVCDVHWMSGVVGMSVYRVRIIGVMCREVWSAVWAYE